MSGSKKGKEAYYRRKHQAEQAGKRIRQFKETRKLRLLIK